MDMQKIFKRQAEKLERLAGEINEEHRQCETALTSGLQHAIRAGELLEEAKGSLGHGNWLGWLKQNFAGSVRTAQAYMRVARKRGNFEVLEDSDEKGNAQRAAHLSLRDTLKALAEPTAKEITQDTRREIEQEERATEGEPLDTFDEGAKRMRAEASEELKKWTAPLKKESEAMQGVTRVQVKGPLTWAGTGRPAGPPPQTGPEEQPIEPTTQAVRDPVAREIEATRAARAAEGANEIRRIVRAGAMEYVVEWGDGVINTVHRNVLFEQGYKKCLCCGGYGVVEGRQENEA